MIACRVRSNGDKLSVMEEDAGPPQQLSKKQEEKGELNLMVEEEDPPLQLSKNEDKENVNRSRSSRRVKKPKHIVSL